MSVQEGRNAQRRRTDSAANSCGARTRRPRAAAERCPRDCRPIRGGPHRQGRRPARWRHQCPRRPRATCTCRGRSVAAPARQRGSGPAAAGEGSEAASPARRDIRVGLESWTLKPVPSHEMPAATPACTCTTDGCQTRGGYRAQASSEQMREAHSLSPALAAPNALQSRAHVPERKGHSSGVVLALRPSLHYPFPEAVRCVQS